MQCLVWFTLSLPPASARAHNWYFDSSLQKLNSISPDPGDTIFLRGGTIFNGPLRLPAGTTGTSRRPIVITSYGTGTAIIDGADGSGVALYHVAYITLSNLELRGIGRKDGNNASGLVINTCRHISVSGLIVHGFQKSGVYIYQSSHIQVLRTTARDNGYAGIAAEGPYGKHDCDHILIKDCRAENNPGDPSNLSNHSGNGIVVGYCRNISIEGCIATNNGWDMPRIGNGPVGIWAFETDSVTIRHCISFRNRTAKGAEDGGGFDLDGGVTHSEIAFCLSYDNECSGFGLFQYAGASPWHDNTIHDCISNNDGLVSTARAGVYIWNGSRDPRQLRNCNFYNNTVYNTAGAAIHYATDAGHNGFRFYHNAFIATDSLVRGMRSPDDVFSGNHWTGVLPDTTFH
jgi:hypothetical protein